ncbi:Mth938-like domain-containing protein [Maritimibacter dapengensis]|uniref:Mth938-like domain-containing protein n=1 Tax=Maritimibacter dapengensis TaxID=2836868 RepID=A0ABS6T274_9RHOB|nr:Mth938-like domain-containing protein [Maritimibacter dapengensis]MBV7378467.1 Mth938-like domain-containing protein [Maritimibacter dapengensis]
MEMHEVTYDGAQPIEGYGPGFFRVAGQVIRGPMLATGKRAKSWGGLDDLAALLDLAGEVDVLFLGTGSEMDFAPKTMAERLDAAGIGVEPMATPSACRTYNVTLSEGRRVALAVLPI